MPANLSPEYRDAEAAYRKARDPKERLECLREMLRTIPKHKGTEHLQADIRSRIKEVTQELGAPRKGGAHTGPALVVRAEGAAQVALLGPPNVGKSSLHARLTGSHAAVGPYPFTTQLPLPGMLLWEDVHIQLVDLPPVSAEAMQAWTPGALEQADGTLLVIDLAEVDCIEQVEAIRHRLEEKGVALLEQVRANASSEDDDELADPFRIHLPTLLVANKCDRLRDPRAELEAFLELESVRFTALAVSAETGHGLDAIGARLFEMLGIVRVYTRVPGHAAEHERPFTLRRGATVRSLGQHRVSRPAREPRAPSVRPGRGRAALVMAHAGPGLALLVTLPRATKRTV
ncbi:MAG TPA: GTPase [Vicinamibacteria bacterium]|nr:GTPase [Vicinamibacteria bacterium]